MRRLALSALFGAVVANGALLRAGEKPAAKVKQLIRDVEESISKAGGDAEMIFSTLYTYDGQLDTSLQKEIGTLNQTLTKLLSMQATYTTDIRKSHAKLTHLGSAAEDSTKMATKYQVGTSQTKDRFEGLQRNLQMLVSLLKSAGVTPQGKLITPETPDARGEPARVYSAIRRLLAANTVLRVSHPAVYAAFLPPSNSGHASTQQPAIRMTEDLLQETIFTLTSVKERLSSMKSEALIQFESMHRRFEKEAVFAGAGAQAQQGLEAENEQKAAELTFSIKFTDSILKVDRKFSEAVRAHVKSNADLIYSTRDLRQAQLKILRDLTGILGAEGSIASPGMSFLQTSDETPRPHAGFEGLQTEAEVAIQNNGDTHAILMHVQEMLDTDSPINSNSVRSTMVEMEDVLHSVELDKSKFEEAKRGCESQKFHANEEDDSLKANLALMTAARDHAEKAIKAANGNVKGIEKKAAALQKSSKDFARISAQAIKSLEGQSHDRATIMMAVRKASEVVGPSLPAGVSTVQLMDTLLQDMATQETKERLYRSNQVAFQSEFATYVQDYTQLLQERRRHYQSTLGILQLHVSELANDLIAQQQTLSTGDDLTIQSKGLCESVIKFYEKHTKLRTDLSSTMRSIIPSMPTVLSPGAIASTGDV